MYTIARNVSEFSDPQPHLLRIPVTLAAVHLGVEQKEEISMPRISNDAGKGSIQNETITRKYDYNYCSCIR
jgi:hypothetical protein